MPQIALPNRPVQLHRLLRYTRAFGGFEFGFLREAHRLLVEDLADGGNARGAGDDDDEGGGFAVDGGEDAGCWAGVSELAVLVDEGY